MIEQGSVVYAESRLLKKTALRTSPTFIGEMFFIFEGGMPPKVQGSEAKAPPWQMKRDGGN